MTTTPPATAVATSLAQVPGQFPPDVLARLEQIDRTATQHVEDSRPEKSQTVQRRLNGINGRIQQAAQEVERRAGLTPQRQQAEEAARQRGAAQQAQAPQIRPPAPKITGPEGPARGGASL